MGKIVINGQNYGKVVIGQEGGGVIPECGIVPTEFADNGFVVSVDSYGDVMPYALYSSLNYEEETYRDLIRETDIPESIDVSEIWWDDNYPPQGDVSTNFINELTFKTTPTIIGKKAFYNQKLLQIDELPEGIEEIQEEAFYGCSNVKLSYIPASVQKIGADAFTNSNDPHAGVKIYDSNSTYSIGDVIINNDDSHAGYYTCIYNIETPEEFNSDHWAEIFAPGIVGIYNPNNTYADGDGVIVSDASNSNDSYTSCTCVEMFVKPQITSYYKNLKGYYNPNNSYNSGDVVTSDDSVIDCFTCLVDNPSMSPFDDTEKLEWVEGNYPYIEGSYDSETEYQVGDYIFNHDYHSDYTCYATPPVGSGISSNYWAEGYCPLNEGLYDSTKTYNVGDVVIVNSGSIAEPYTCIVPVTTPEAFDHNKWKGGYYPEISTYSNSVSYNIGDTVVYDGDIYTCIAPSTGNEPDYSSHTSYWSAHNQYDPDVVGVFDDSNIYNLGDIVYENDNFKTILNGGGEQIVPVPGWVPDSLGVYDPTRTYLAGDIVVIESEGSYDPMWMICISPTPITGEYDENNWKGLMESSTPSYCKINKLQFLGTPNSVDSAAFNGSGYNMVLVPWEQGEGPEIGDGVSPAFVVYGYNPEGE